MLNKKQMEAKGFSFEKIDGVEYLDLSKPKPKVSARCPVLEAEQAMRNHFLENSQDRGKALSVIIPLINQEDMTDLLSELYDLREESKERKVADEMAVEMVEGIVSAVRKDVDDILKNTKNEKCRPTKKQPQRKPQKKVGKKK